MFLSSFFINIRTSLNPVHRSANALCKIAAQKSTRCVTFRPQHINVQNLSTYYGGRSDAPAPIRLAPKWGFIVYRCTYEDDASWNKFISAWKSIVMSKARRFYKDGERLADTFDMTIKEDRLTLEGASAEVVRAQHLAWARSNPLYVASLSEVGAQDTFWTRYDFCVYVDAEALQSCLRYIALPEDHQKALDARGNNHTLGQPPFVNVVTCQVIPLYQGLQKVVEDVYDGEQVAIRAYFPDVMTDVYGAINDELFDQWVAGIRCGQDGVTQF